jgi:predicted ATPase/DNA-binding SARP family transcriptional activator
MAQTGGASSATLTVSLLGPVELTAGGEPFALSGQRPTALLALLALNAGRVVPVERLIDDVWGEAAPKTVRASIQVHISNLRRSIAERTAGAYIATRHPGYLLDIAPEQVDALAFEQAGSLARQLFADGDAVTAASVADGALGMWRGDALSGMEEAAFAASTATRLEERRLDLLEVWADAQIGCGRPESVVARLEPWVERVPYRESLWQRLILALYRCGRQADALDRITRLRRLLRDDLGVRPSPSIVELETALLEQDGSLDSTEGRRTRSDRLSGPGRRLPASKELIGRQALIDDLVGRLETCRTISLVGPGGAGKTSVAVNVAAGCAARRADGAWFVDLATVSSGNLVATAIGSALGLHPGEQGVAIDDVVELLFDKSLLLVVDNCEHVVGDVARAVDAILSRCDAVHVLTTSREPLGLLDEVTVRIPTLDEAGSVALLRRQAARVGAPEFSAEDDHLADALCLAVDRLPLGIELVAGRLRSMSVADVARDLDAGALLHVDASRGQNLRHRSLHSTISWSYELLPEPCKTLLRRLAAFQGGAHLDAILAVCTDAVSGYDEASTTERLDSLVSTSLVSIERVDGRLRYRLLEMVRAFALELLTDSEGDEVRRRHTREMCDWALRMRRIAEGVDPAPAFAAIHTEVANLRAAVRHCHQTGDSTSIVDLVGALGPFLGRYSGAIAELEEWIEFALAVDGTRSASRLDVLLVAGFASPQPDHQVRSRAAEAHRLAVTLDDPRAVAFSEHLLGDAHLDVASPAIERHLTKSIAIAEAAGLHPFAGASLNSLGNLLIRQRRFDDAEQLLGPRVAMSARYGASEAFVLYQHARLKLECGEHAAAAAAFETVMRAAERSGMAMAIGYAWFGKAMLATAVDDLSTARGCLERSLAIDEQISAHREILNDRIKIIEVSVKLGDLDTARAHCRAVAEMARLNPGPREIGAREQGEGRVALADGDLGAARGHLVDSMRAFASTEMTGIFLDSLEMLAGALAPEASAQVATVAVNLRQQRCSMPEALEIVEGIYGL